MKLINVVRGKNNGITQPSGAATPRNSDAHERVAVPQALCALREHTRPRPKSGKAVLTPGHAGFLNRAKRSDGSDTTPARNAPVSPCEPLCAILLAKARVYPLSPVKTNVNRLCECDLKPLWKGLSPCRMGRTFSVFQARGKSLPKRFQITLAQTVPHSVFTGESGYTLAARQQDRTQRLTGETGAVSSGGGITTIGPFCAVQKPCVAGGQNGFAAFGS